MRDPFRPNSNSQLIREAQIGLSLVAILMFLFVYVAYYRISGIGRTIPEHVRLAPVAEQVWPNSHTPTAQAEAQETIHERIMGFLPRRDVAARPSDRNEVANQSRPSKLTNSVRQSSYEESIERAVEDPIVPAFDEASHNFQRNNNSRPLTINTTIQPDNSEPARPKQKIASGPNDPFYMQADPVPTQPPNKLSPKTGQTPVRVPQPLSSIKQNSISQFEPVASVPLAPARRIPAKAHAVAGNTSELKVEVVDGAHVSAVPSSSNLFQAEPRLQSPYPLQVNELRSGTKEIESTQPAPLLPPTLAIELASSDDFAPARNTQNEALQPTPQPRPTSASNSKTTSSVESVMIASFDTAPRIVPHPSSEKALKISKTTAADNDTANSFVSQIRSADTVLKPGSYSVTTGDSFWTIAQQVYGDGNYFRALYEFNRYHVRGFENLNPGTLIDTPPADLLAQRWPELCPSSNQNIDSMIYQDLRQYETQTGDTLFEIARQRLGQASRYLEILNLNSSRLPQGVSHLSPLPGKIQLVMPQ